MEKHLESGYLNSLMSIISPEKINCQIWIENHLKTEKGIPIRFDDRPYLKDCFKAIWRTRRIVIKKGAQVGVSTYAIGRAIWSASNFAMTIIYTLPTDGDVLDFTQGRIDPMLRLSELTIPVNVDNSHLKQIRNSFIYLRGTWTERKALSVPSDFNIYDEVDFSRPDVREMYNERLSASEYKWILEISTPTIPKFGISDIYEASTKNIWLVSCLKCGLEQEITEENIIDEEFRCLKCKEILDRTKGRWHKQKESEVEGYHIPQLIANWITAKEVLDKKKDYTQRDYFNFVLGQEFSGKGTGVEREDIYSILIPENQIPLSGTTTIGVDWGDTTWIAVRRDNVLILFDKITGDTRTHPQKVANLMEKFNAYAICDFGYGDTKNKALIDMFPGRVYMCVYNSKSIYPERNDKERTIKISRSIAIEETINEIKNKKIKIVVNDFIPELVKHFKNLIIKDEEGKEKYDRKGDDHLVHAIGYSRLLTKKQVQIFL